MATQSTRHLVAPELEPGIDAFPVMDFSQGMEVLRGGMLGREMPPMPAELEAVSCAERFIPGAPGDPDVRVLHYTPPGAAKALRPAVLEIHGGGYVIGNADMSDVSNRVVALNSRLRRRFGRLPPRAGNRLARLAERQLRGALLAGGKRG